MCETKMKTCSKCKREFPANNEYFHNDAKRKDGLYPQCRECKTKRKLFSKEGYKICNKCNEELPMNTDYFFKNKETKDGFLLRCKRCVGYEYTDKLTKIPKEGYKFCIKCDRELKATISYFPPDKACKDGLRNVCRECGKDGHFMSEDYVPKEWWTEEENKLFVERYPHYTNEELIEIFYPDCTEKDLWDKAYRSGGIVKSKETRERSHRIQGEKLSGENSPFYGVPKSEETRRKLSESKKGKYVGENSWWFGKKRSLDQRIYLSKIKKELGQWKGENNPRHIKPLYKEDNGNWQGGISALYVHLRRNIQAWKNDSMKDCNYKCVLTSGNFDNIHHLYNFSDIVSETLEILNLPIYDEINKYTKEELLEIEKVCLDLHYKYGLGVCLRKDIHKLFHDTYGYSNNSKGQFSDFVKRFKNGEFIEVLNEEVVI